MKKYIKKHYSITDKGASDLVRAVRNCFFSYLVMMLPIMILLLTIDTMFFNPDRSTNLIIIVSVVSLFILGFFLNLEYGSLYDTTYAESENMRVEIARTLASLPLSYFSKHDLSDLAQTIMSDVAGIEHALSNALPHMLAFKLYFVVMAIVLVVYQPILGIAVILPLLINFLLIRLSKKYSVNENSKYYHKLRENADSFQETIENQQEIKTLGMEESVRDDLYKKMDESEKIHIKDELSIGVILNLSGVVLNVSLVLVVLIGVKMLVDGNTSILVFIAYLLAAIKLQAAASEVDLNQAELYFIETPINRIKEMTSTKTQEGEDVKLNSFDIELKNVSFSYDESTHVLDDVSFVAKQNEVTALVGKSGCGKTSLLRLISRLYDYDSGSILIDGKDIKNISTKSLFDKVSIVFQDVTLFNSSVLENIRLGRLDATDEEVKEAARLANCEEFIDKLSDGYNTLIGENGASLSGGERQRLSIARAILKDAPIIILDEIAASLDVENEKKIQESLNKLIKNKTVIIISHRLKSIENADKIVVINDGKVESMGKHTELLKTSPTYQKLVKSSKLAEEFRY